MEGDNEGSDDDDRDIDDYENDFEDPDKDQNNSNNLDDYEDEVENFFEEESSVEEEEGSEEGELDPLLTSFSWRERWQTSEYRGMSTICSCGEKRKSIPCNFKTRPGNIYKCNKTKETFQF